MVLRYCTVVAISSRRGPVRTVCFAVLLASSVLLGTVAGTIFVGTAAGTDVSVAQQPREISSCTTISQSGEYVLTRDVGRNADQTCIAIEANNVVLDGAGYTVRGDGTNGVLVTADRVTVRNLTAEGWLYGVRFFEAEQGIVTNVTATNNRIGISVFDSENVEVRINDATGNENNGLALVRSDSNAVRNNMIRDNGQIGLVVTDGDDNSLTDNVVTGNALIGIHIAYSDENALANNAINATTYGVGIQLSAANGNELTRNVVLDNSASGIVLVNSDDNDVQENTVCRNGGYVVETPASTGNVIENNRDEC